MKDDIDYLLEMLEELKERFTRAKLKGISYELYLRQVEPDAFWEEDPADIDGRMYAVKSLQEAGIVKSYTVEERYDNGIYPVYKAVCLVNEDLLGSYLEQIKEDAQAKKNIKFFNGKDIKFSFNLDTGDFQLNETKGNFTLNGQEYNFLKTVFTSNDYQSGYATLISNIWNGRENSKASRMDLALLLKKIKRTLKILPAKASANPDIFKNIKGFGYRLVAQ